MTIQSINQKAAVESLKRGESFPADLVRFNGEMIESADAFLLRKNGLPVPENLVYYDDEAIDYSDDPASTHVELAQMRRVGPLCGEVPIDQEIAGWVARRNIDINLLLASLLNDFYKNLKATSPSQI